MSVVKPSSETFEEVKFMKELYHLKDTQEAIQSLSGWCIRNRKYAYKITRCWLKTAKKAKPEQRLTLFHLLNDVVQHSKRKNFTDLLEKFEAILKEIMPYMKEEKICDKVHRCLNIWNERQVFSEKFIEELQAVIKQNRAEQDLIDNFQPQQLCTQIKIMRALEDDTDYKLKTLKESDLNLVDVDEASLRQSLKDRQHGSDYINDVDEGKQRLELYIKAVDREISKRRQIIELLTIGSKYYDSLLGEANIVANAYHNYGRRIRAVQEKLIEGKLPELKNASKDGLLAAADLSPIPSPDYDAPSPQAGELELELPDEKLLREQQLKEREKTSEDFNSRLDSMRSHMAATEAGTGSVIFSKLMGTESVVQPPIAQVAAPTAAAYVAAYPVTAQVGSEQDQAWWDPPPATAWPAPRPDPWTDPLTAEPIPEWQIPTVDEIPEDDGEDENLADIVLPEAFMPNLALQRLQQQQQSMAKTAITTLAKVNADSHNKKPNNLIDLTSTQKISGGGTEDMEMSSDEDDLYKNNGSAYVHHHHHHPPPPVHHQPPPQTPAQAHTSLQERLKSLAGMPSTVSSGPPLPPSPMGHPPPTIQPTSFHGPPPPSVAGISPPPVRARQPMFPSGAPPPPLPPSAPGQGYPRGPPNFDHRPRGGGPVRQQFNSPDVRQRPPPRFDHQGSSNFRGSPLRGGGGGVRGSRGGPRW